MKKSLCNCESCRYYLMMHNYAICDLTDNCFSFKGKCPYFRHKKIIKYPLIEKEELQGINIRIS